MKITDLELKELKLVTDYEEVQKIIQKVFSDKRMVDYIFKNYYFFKTKDNKYIEIRKFNSYSITKTIWYDDEKEAPDKTLKNFINAQSWKYFDFNNENKYFYSLIQAYDSEPNILRLDMFLANGSYGRVYDIYELNKNHNLTIQLLNYEWRCPYLPEKKQNANTDLINDLKKILEFNNKSMLNRLEKYFYKYNNQIHVDGYWANR